MHTQRKSSSGFTVIVEHTVQRGDVYVCMGVFVRQTVQRNPWNHIQRIHSSFHFFRYKLHQKYYNFCFFVLMLNVPVNNFSVMSGRSHRFLDIISIFRGVNVLAQGHNTAEVGKEPPTSRSGVRDSTTMTPRSITIFIEPRREKPTFCICEKQMRS